MQGNIEEIENMGSMGRRGNIVGCDAGLCRRGVDLCRHEADL